MWLNASIARTYSRTVKHHITRFEKRDTRINKQRSVFKKLVKSVFPVYSACTNSQGIIYYQIIYIFAFFVPRCVVLDCMFFSGVGAYPGVASCTGSSESRLDNSHRCYGRIFDAAVILCWHAALARVAA